MPDETLFASHDPCQRINLNPELFNFSMALDDAFLDEEASVWASSGRRPGVCGSSNVDDWRLGVGARPAPGCLKMPKLIDFLSGRMLQDMVWSGFALT